MQFGTLRNTFQSVLTGELCLKPWMVMEAGVLNQAEISSKCWMFSAPGQCFAMGTSTLHLSYRSLRFMIISSLREETHGFLFCNFPSLCFSLKKQMEKKISNTFSCKDDFLFVSVHLFQLLIPHSKS